MPINDNAFTIELRMVRGSFLVINLVLMWRVIVVVVTGTNKDTTNDH